MSACQLCVRPAKHLKTHTALILVAHGTFVPMEHVLAQGPNCKWHHKKLSCWITDRLFLGKKTDYFKLERETHLSANGDPGNERQSYIIIQFTQQYSNIYDYTAL